MTLPKRSTRLRDFAKAFHTQTKHPNLKFKDHDNTLIFDSHPEYVKEVFGLLKRPFGNDFWIQLRQIGRRSVILDGDTLLNKKWAAIWRCR